MNLAAVKFLWRQTDSLALYGISHELRDGQAPRDLVQAEWPCRHEHDTCGMDLTKCPPRKPAGDVPSDWLWLGQPGWFCKMPEADIVAVKTFLAEHKHEIPGGPGEWCALGEVPK